MRICPNDNFIEIFAQRFHYFEDPFHKFFALNLVFQDTSHRLAIKYSSFLCKFFSFAFYNINFWFKISRICPKFRIFFKFLTSEGTLFIDQANHAIHLLNYINQSGIAAHIAPIKAPITVQEISLIVYICIELYESSTLKMLQRLKK